MGENQRGKSFDAKLERLEEVEKRDDL